MARTNLDKIVLQETFVDKERTEVRLKLKKGPHVFTRVVQLGGAGGGANVRMWRIRHRKGPLRLPATRGAESWKAIKLSARRQRKRVDIQDAILGLASF